MIDIVATHPHYWDHLKPIATELQERGHEVFVYRDPAESLPTDRERVAVVSSYGDYRRAFLAERKIVFMEHGAGQTYRKQHSSYAGSPHRQGVVAFLAPGPHVIKANERRFAHVPQVPVGVPKLDRWHREPKAARRGKPVVVISFHWDCKVDYESRSAFSHYSSGLSRLIEASEYEIRGHCHPKARAMVRPVYEALGIPFIEQFSDVLDQADLYVCDNSSTIYEFASTSRPVVLLNAPWYRREIEVGLRFWKEARVGMQCDNPGDLHSTILQALSDPNTQREAREASIRRVYSYTDGRATERAADAIEEVIMAAKEVKPEGFRVTLRSLRNQEGPYGRVGPDWTIEVTADTIYITNSKGEKRKPVALTNPYSEASLAHDVALWTMDRGRQTKFVRVTAEPEAAPEEKQAPPAQEDKRAPKPGGNKLAPAPEETKVETIGPSTVENAPVENVAAFTALENDILDRLREGEGKSTIVTELRQRNEYTEKAVKESFDALLERGIVTKSGPDNRPVYEVQV